MFHLAAQGGSAARRKRRALQDLRQARPTRQPRPLPQVWGEAVTRAAALDSFGLGVRLSLEAGIDEIQHGIKSG